MAVNNLQSAKLKNRFEQLSNTTDSRLASVEHFDVSLPQLEFNAPKKFNIEQVEIIKELGRGSFGKVKLVRIGNQYYAMKCLSKDSIRNKKQVQHIRNERDILKMFKPLDFCCTIIESLQDEHNLYMLLEYLPGGELYKHIRKARHLNEADSRFYLAEIVLGVETLHKMGIIYRDLKPENILLDRGGHVKLIDFGFAKVMNNIYKDKAYTNCGTPGYCAPEVMMEIGHTYKADIWSIGILICEIMGGFTPFQGRNEASNPRAIMEKCRSGKLNLPKNLNPNARDLIKLLLIEDPQSRLEISEIKTHAFFKHLDWKKLQNRQV